MTRKENRPNGKTVLKTKDQTEKKNEKKKTQITVRQGNRKQRR